MQQIYKTNNKLGWLLPLIAILFIVFTIAMPQKSMAQSPINYVEYYVNQDPGLGNAIPVPVTAATTITNATFNVDVNALPQGVHILAARARTTSGIWSMGHYWFIFKPYTAIIPAAVTNITRVEYFIDTDPGMGNGTAVTITPASNLADVAFTINPAALSKGTHIVGTRARDANGNWSHTNFWLFYNPFTNTATPAAPGNITNVEYYIDIDPGVGNALPISVAATANVQDNNFIISTTNLTQGTHMVGARAKDANGNWSQTNNWLFVKPFTNTIASALPNITAMEYFVDYDPGMGNGTTVPITAGTNFTDLAFSVDVTNLVAGSHFIVARTRDANGNWSMVNNWAFTKPGTPPTMTTIVSTTTLCAGSNINVGYQLSDPIVLNASNQFIAQLSDANGSFVSPTTIGSIVSTNNTTNSFNCIIPANTVERGAYRIRVISTNQSVVASNNGTNITIYSLPTVPTFVSPLTDTTVCQGNQLQLTTTTSNGSYQWLLNGNAIANANTNIYTVANATTANVGAYSLRISNYSSTTCNVISAIRNIAINTNVAAIPTLSPSGSIGVCLGNSRTLTSSIATSYQWKRNGANIAGATNATYDATLAGTYTVATGNGSVCLIESSNNAIVTIGLAATKPTIVAGGPTTFCQNGNVTLTSSAFSGNQWYKNGVAESGQVNPSFSATQTGYYKTLVSGGGCEVLSDSVLVTVNVNVAPSVVLSSPGSNIPLGTPLTFTATPTNGGVAPQYSFRVNSITAQSGSSNTYTTSSLIQGDQVTCILTSNANCVSPTTATSIGINITIAPNVTVSGRVYHPVAGFVPTVKLRISNGITDSVVTDANSRYSASLFQQRNYTVTPNKNNDQVKANGVNVQDVLQIQAHVLGSTLLNTPYKIIAADANSDGAVNIFDVLAVKRLILGMDTSFAGGKLWSFVDSAYTFPNPANPFPYTSTKSYSNITSSYANQSFIGVKLGDVTLDWAATAGVNRINDVQKTLQLFYDTVIAEKGDVVRIKLKVRNFNQLKGMQFTLAFNQQVFEFASIENKQLPVEFSAINIDKGAISFIWADANNTAKTLADGSLLFEMVLLKKQASSRDDISISASYTPAMAFNAANQSYSIEKVEGIILDKKIQPFVAGDRMEVGPNPSQGIVTVKITSSEAKNIVLVVSDVYGRTILQKSISLNIGLTQVPLNLKEKKAIANGVYYLKANGFSKIAPKELLIIGQ